VTTIVTSEAYEAEIFFQREMESDSALVAAAPSGIWAHPAPEHRDGVWVTHHMQSGTDALTSNSVRVWNDQLWLIRAYVQDESFTPLKAAAAAIDRLFARRSDFASTDHALIYYVRREMTWMRPEVSGGKEYRSLGGMYRIAIQLTGN
jgi:hypothetical protein